MMRSVTAATPLRDANTPDAEVLAQLLPGDGFALLDLTGGMAWGYRLADHLVGYCPADCLGAPIAPTHRVVNADAGLYAAADDAAPPVSSLPAGSLVMGSASDAWLETPHGWMRASDVEEVPATTADN